MSAIEKNTKQNKISRKQYRVKEKIRLEVWTYLYADSIEHAEHLLNKGFGEEDINNYLNLDDIETKWGSLEEVPDNSHVVI